LRNVEQPDPAELYEELRRRGVAPPRPREYGLRVIAELLRIARPDLEEE